MRVQFRCRTTAIVLETLEIKSVSISGKQLLNPSGEVIAGYEEDLGWVLPTHQNCHGEDCYNSMTTGCYANVEIGE